MGLKPKEARHGPCMKILNSLTYKTVWDENDVDRARVFERLEVEGFYLLKIRKDSVEIIRLIVGWEFRRRGVGSLLLDDIIALGKDIQIIIEEHDDYGLAWLRKRGFTGVGVRKNFFGGEDGWILRRSK